MIITFLTIICWENVSYGGGQIVLLRRFSLFLLSSCGHHDYTCIFLQLKLLAIFSQFIVLLVCLLTMEYQEIQAISNKGFDFVSQHTLPPFPRSQDPTQDHHRDAEALTEKLSLSQRGLPSQRGAKVCVLNE